MEREMQQVKAYVNTSGNIVLVQGDGVNDDGIVCLNPAQIDLVIQWLKELKEEAIEFSQDNDNN